MPNAPVVPVRVSSARPFLVPKPNFLLMRLLGVVNRWWILEGLPVLRRVPLLQELPVIRGHFRVSRIEMSAADRKRLADAVNGATAAFLGPNHPEFGLDWMMDKEISTFAAPRMASWASHEIVASAPGFWTRNNLISHRGGSAAIEYSVKWALRGHGVLLHPEGSVHWTSDKVHPLFHGIAEMATEAARRTIGGGKEGEGRPVFIVPIVWKLRYTRDVSARMHREMSMMEAALGLRRGARGASVAERFAALQRAVLERQMARFGFAPAPVAELDFFSRQEAFRTYLLEDLESRYAIEPGDSIERKISRLERTIPAERKLDRATVAEVSRLGGFCRDVYGTPRLTQEQMFESLKRHRATLMVRGLRNVLHNCLPTPFGPRVAHVRVPEPILIDAARASADPAERAAYVTSLIERAHRSMQDALDSINDEIAGEVDAYSSPNPFFVGAAADRGFPALV